MPINQNNGLIIEKMRFSSMKNLKYRTSGLFLILIMIFFIIGCVSEPVKVDVSANHPANPGAQEAEFRPPPNPFKENVNAMKGGSTPDSDSTKKTGHGEDDNQHKGHSQ
jgi:hypothetical protein